MAGVALSSGAGGLIEAAAAQTPAGKGTLKDIEHVVILMQENRSFDHYFGRLSGTRGFADKRVIDQSVHGKKYPIFDQFGYAPGVGVDPSGYLQPFHLASDPPREDGQTANDITHSWGPQH
jgi:phospholipase C